MADVNIKINLITKNAQKELGKLSDQLAKINTQIGGKDGIGGTGPKRGVDNFRRSFGRVADIAKGIVSANLFFAIGQQIKNAFRFALTSVIEFEQGLVGVQKTTGLSGRALAKLGDDIQSLSSRLPVAQAELLNIAKIAGQLGVRGRRDLTRFTETVARLAASTDLSAEQASLALSRILNITGEGTENIDNLASSVTALGNQFETLESELVTAASEVARSTAGFGLQSQEVTALGAALKSLGARAEGGGTAIGKVFRQIEKSINEGGDSLRTFQELTGLTADELKKEFAEDSLGVFQKFLEGANKSADSFQQILVKTGLNTDRVNKALRPLIANYQKVNDTVRVSNEEFEKNEALTRESNLAFSTLGSELSKFGNVLKSTVVDQLDDTRGLLKDTIKFWREFLEEVRNTDDEEKTIQLNNQLSTLEQRLAVAKTRYTALNKESERLKGGGRVKLLGDTLEEITPKVNLAGANVSVLQGEIASLRAELDLLSGVDTGEILGPQQTTQRATKDEIKAEEQKNLKLAELRAQNRALILEEQLTAAGVEEERRELALIGLEEAQQQELDKIRILDAEKITDKIKLEQALLKIENDAKKRKIESDKKAAQASLAISEKEIRQKIELQRAFFNFASSIAKDGSKAQFVISKAAALAQAIQSKALAIATANAIVDPTPTQSIKTAAVARASLIGNLQIASIVASSIKGFQDGGIIGGQSTSGDRVLARVNSGEMILNRQQQTNLFNQIQSPGAQQSEVPLQNNITVEIDGEAVTKAVSRSVANGTILGEAGV